MVVSANAGEYPGVAQPGQAEPGVVSVHVERDVPETDLPASQPPKKLFRVALREVLWVVVFVTLPASVATLLTKAVVSRFRLWDSAEWIFIATLTLTYCIFTVSTVYVVPALISWLTQPAKPRPQSQSRIRWLLRAGVGPVVTVALGVLVNVASDGTAFQRLSSYVNPGPPLTLAARVGTAVIASTSTSSKIEGIEALAVLASDEALDQLFRIFRDDARSLRDARVTDVLARAFGSFPSPKARERLRLVFEESEGHVKAQPSGVGIDLYGQFLAGAFGSLERELIQSGAISGEQLLTAEGHLAQLQGDVKSELARLEAQVALGHGEPALDVILQSFLYMSDLTEDSHVRVLAKRVARDRSFRESTRRKALALIGKIGTPEDFEDLITYATPEWNETEPIKTSALAAIGSLQCKLTGRAIARC